MKKGKSKLENDDLRPEYDLSQLRGAVRGKYLERDRAGPNLALLAPDVRAAFPTDEAVNQPLWSLMQTQESGSTMNDTAAAEPWPHCALLAWFSGLSLRSMPGRRPLPRPIMATAMAGVDRLWKLELQKLGPWDWTGQLEACQIFQPGSELLERGQSSDFSASVTRNWQGRTAGKLSKSLAHASDRHNHENGDHMRVIKAWTVRKQEGRRIKRF